MSLLRQAARFLFAALLLSCAGCSPESSEPAFRPEAVTGAFAWDRARGQTIKVSLCKHPFADSLVPQLPEFTARTGIRVELNVLSEEEYRDKMVVELSSGGGTVDVFMTGPYSTWSYVKGNWVEPLDGYLRNPALTGPDYHEEDFFPAIMAANRWNGKMGYQNYGQGSQWAIPVMVESYILAYRRDWARERNLRAPRTYAEFYDFARAMTRQEGEEQRYGITARGLGTWPTIATGFIGGLRSSGGGDFDDRMKCTIHAPAAVAFTTLWMKTIRECGPKTWTSNTWYDAKEQFESGRFGMIFDCDFFAAGYENPEKSRVAGKLAYALPPAGPDGTLHSSLWTWALALNRAGKHKTAAWLFVQWATSGPQLKRASLAGNWNPVRKSVWNDSDVQAQMARWGNYREVVEENLQRHVRICLTPQAQFAAVGDRWARSLQEIWSGADPKAALDAAAEDIERIVAGMEP